MTIYSRDFMAYADRSAFASAELIIRHLIRSLPIRTVLDVGCARGAWLATWRRVAGCEVTGIDGSYVDRDTLHIAHDAFVCHDLSQPFAPDRRYDLVQSLEVAEHLPAARAQGFVANLTAGSDMVLFAAARPGQGGEGHVNEQSYEYWRDIFHQLGFEAFDAVRPLIQDERAVSWWYRYNLLLYVAQSRVASLPPDIAASHLPMGRPIPDFAPLSHRLRCAAIRLLPRGAQDFLARIKAFVQARR